MTGAVVVRYETRDEAAAELNQRLVEDVFAELNSRDPGGLRYLALRAENGTGFVHVAIFDGSGDPFADCAAFQRFQADVGARLSSPPTVTRAQVVGTYLPQQPGVRA
ncbi:hypothetical protein [Nocardia stercoris]|uniref:Antibiotic biosynthesis monooxygenase n=1 Tax=Nocardia stercoris TaxID=2483361 RepID=A0A3M2KW68_9NOCA|nr:hypothetical protein [Nocardia stercoris]RMI29729.1 hypothetical protein EBN03_24765 [Nocardia stercoris]